MLNKIKLILSNFFVKGLLRNSFYSYLKAKIRQIGKYFFILISLVIAANIITWFVWLGRIINSGFAIESHFNVILNLPLIPHFYSLLFLNTFISIVNIVLSFAIYKKTIYISYLFLFFTFLLNISILAVTVFYIVSYKL